MKKIFLILIKILLGLLLLIMFIVGGILLYQDLYYEGFFMSKKERYFYSKFKELKDSGEKKILLKQLTDFEWDGVACIEPYSGLSEDIQRNFKIRETIEEDDRVNTFVFLDHKSMEGSVMIFPRRLFSAQCNIDGIEVLRDDAYLDISTGDSKDFLKVIFASDN